MIRGLSRLEFLMQAGGTVKKRANLGLEIFHDQKIQVLQKGII